jgi:hypothetical protein
MVSTENEGLATMEAPAASRVAAWSTGLLSISPFAVALDLFLHFLPDLPVIQYMRAAGPLAQSIWIACGLLGIGTVVMLQRRPMVGFFLSIVFAGIYVPTAMTLWRHVSWGCWLAIATVLMAAAGAWQARSSNASKHEAAPESA